MLAIAIALLLAASLPVVLAHGDEMPGMDMGAMQENASVTTTSDFEYNPSYFHYREHARLMNAHIALTMLSWVGVLPIGGYLHAHL